MLAILPCLTLACLWLAFVRLLAQTPFKWRSAFMLAILACGLFTAILTELLSLWNAITFGWLAVSWSAAALLAAGLCIWAWWPVPRLGKSRLSLPVGEIAIATGALLILATTGLIAWAAPPNNWDSMTYHMSRVAHWAHNQTVAFYPTGIVRQLLLAPWAEYAILLLYGLTGSDRLANFVQWGAWLGCAVGASLIAGLLGARRPGQGLAAVLALTTPMLILQSTSTQNDLVVALWLVCLSACILLEIRTQSWIYVVGIGASLGLAIFTKGTGMVFALPFIVGWSGVKLWKLQLLALPRLVLVALIVLFLNQSFWVRNHAVFGNPLGDGILNSRSTGILPKTTNDIFTPVAFASNIVRHLATHLGSFAPVNIVLNQVIVDFHEWIGLDPSDPRTTFGGTTFAVTGVSRHEDLAGNPVQFGLIGLAIILIAGWRNRFYPPALLVYTACVALDFLLFSAVIKWQPWLSRLHSPLFVLAFPFVGTAFDKALCDVRRSGEQRTSKATLLRKSMFYVLMLLLFAQALPWVLRNQSRPLVGPGSVLVTPRSLQYFANRPSLATPYQEALAFISAQNCASVGIVLGEDDWEYPLWALSSDQVVFEYMLVQNPSAQLMQNESAPCALLSTIHLPENLQLPAGPFSQQWKMEPVSVYISDQLQH